MAKLLHKAMYKPSAKIEVFYTGGPAVLSTEGLLACACSDEIKIVQAENGGIVATLAGDTEPVTALVYSPGGQILYSASRSQQLRCWDTETNSCVRSWKAHTSAIPHMAVDASGALLATASADHTARVWDTTNYLCTHAFRGHSAVVLQVLFHSKELMLMSSAEDGEVRVWDLVGQHCLASLQGHLSAVTSLSLASDGWTLLSAGRDKVAVLWDLRSRAKIGSIPIFEAVEGAVVLPNLETFLGNSRIAAGRATSKPIFFATAGEEGVVKVWRSDTGRCLMQKSPDLPAREAWQMTSLSLVPGGRQLLSTTSDGRILFLQPQERKPLEEPSQLTLEDLSIVCELVGDLGEVTDLQLVGPPEEPGHVAVATNSAAVRVFEVATCSCCASLEGHSDVVLALDSVQLADGRTMLASGSKDATLRLWSMQVREDGATGAGTEKGSKSRQGSKIPSCCLALAQGHAASVTSVAIARKKPGSFIVSAASDKILKVWDTNLLLQAWLGKSQARGDKPAILRSTAAVAAHDKDINCVALSPNDALVCSTSQDRTAKVWKLPSLVLSLTLRGHKRGVWAAAFSPVEKVVATASGDKTIKLWSLQDGGCLRTLQGHAASVLRLSFLSAGMQVVSSGADGLVKLWNVQSSECTASFEEHEGKVWALTVGGSAEHLMASGGSDARVCIWQDVTEQQRSERASTQAATTAKQQAFANALQEEDFSHAAALAFELDQAGRLLAVVERAQAQGAEQSGRVLSSLVATFSGTQTRQALEYVRQWNTHLRHCHQAHALLHAMLLHHSPQSLMEVPGLEELLAVMAAYTQRHIARMDRLLRSSFLVDYTLARLQVVTPLPASNEVPLEMHRVKRQRLIYRCGREQKR